VYTRPISQNYAQSHAMIASHHLECDDVTERHYARTVVKNYAAAADNPSVHRKKEPTVDEVLDSDLVSWPIRESEIAPGSAGGGAIVLTSADLAREVTDSLGWIEGTGLGSNRYSMRDMDELRRIPSLRAARREAYE